MAVGIGPSSERRCHPFIAVVILRRQQVDRRSFRSLAVAALITIFLIHSLYLSCIAEDAFISFRFAKNLAAGHGFTWNIGEAPVEGYTNFLWVVMSALATLARLDVLRFAQVVGLLASMLAMIYSYRFTHRLLDCDQVYSLIPCLFLAVSGPFATWATSGMETNLFTVCVLMGCYHSASYWRSYSRSDLYVSSVALFLATLTRPEGLLVLVTLLGLGGMMWAQEARNRPRDLLFPLLAYCIPLSIYAIWRFEYFGSLLPNTFYAKTGGTVYQYLRGLRYSAYFGLYFLLPLLPVFGLYWLGSGRPRLGRRLSVRLMTLHVADHVGMYTCLLVCLTYTLYIIYVGGDYMAMDRFFVPLLPLIYTVVGFVTHSVLTSMPDSRGQRAIAAGFLMLAVAATLIQSTPFEKKLFPPPAWQHGHYRGVQAERYHSARLAVIGRFFDDYKRDGNDSLATGTIGAVAYYSNMRIYDFYGLVDPHIAHLKRKRLGRGFPGHEKWDLLHVLSKKPTYVMFSRQLTRAAAPDPDYSYLITQHDRAEIDKIIREDYRLISVWLVDRENSQAGYFTFLELKARDGA